MGKVKVHRCQFADFHIEEFVPIKDYQECNMERLGYKKAEQVAIAERNSLQSQLDELKADNQRLRDFLEGLNEMYPDFIEKTLVVEDREGFFELLNKEKAGE